MLGDKRSRFRRYDECPWLVAQLQDVRRMCVVSSVDVVLGVLCVEHVVRVCMGASMEAQEQLQRTHWNMTTIVQLLSREKRGGIASCWRAGRALEKLKQAVKLLYDWVLKSIA